MKLRTLSSRLLGLALLCATAATQAGDGPVTNATPARAAWIAETASQLRTFKPDDTTPRIVFTQSGHNGVDVLGCQVKKRGLIPLGTNDWVYIVAHSSHLKDNVGDLSLAISARGKLYQHEGHVCGGFIGFIGTNMVPPATSQAFFEAFIDDVDNRPWRPLE